MLFFSVLRCCFRVGTKSCPVLCKRSQTETKTSEIVGTSEGKNGTTMLDYKQKKSSETFHSIYVERGFLKMQQQLSVGLVYP